MKKAILFFICYFLVLNCFSLSGQSSFLKVFFRTNSVININGKSLENFKEVKIIPPSICEIDANKTDTIIKQQVSEKSINILKEINETLEKKQDLLRYVDSIPINISYIGSINELFHLFLLKQQVGNQPQIYRIILLSIDSKREILNAMVLSQRHFCFGENGFIANKIGKKEKYIISWVGLCHSSGISENEKTKYYLRRDKIVLKRNGRIKRRFTIIKEKTTCY